MGLKLNLQWFNKATELGEGEEYTVDFGEDARLITDGLGMTTKDNINNGCFDIRDEWVSILQPHFKHRIEISIYDYQISFDYRNAW